MTYSHLLRPREVEAIGGGFDGLIDDRVQTCGEFAVTLACDRVVVHEIVPRSHSAEDPCRIGGGKQSLGKFGITIEANETDVIRKYDRRLGSQDSMRLLEGVGESLVATLKGEGFNVPQCREEQFADVPEIVR